MAIFDKKGLMLIPSPGKEKKSEEKILLVHQCFCPNGHALISSRARFGDFDGIVLKVKSGRKSGLIALSPVCGDKSRITFGILLEDKKLVDLFCPKCNVKLPAYGSCECGGDLVVMFTDKLNDFNNCVGVCNRVNCKHAEIKSEGHMMTLTASQLY